MKKWAMFGLVLTGLFLFVFQFGCSRHAHDGPEGRLVAQSGCKVFIMQSSAKIVPQDEDECVHYRFSGNTLYLTQQNAAFNCCPGKIDAAITVSDHVISIKETERQAGCRCLCLYDLELEIANLEPGSYRLVIEEPYVAPMPFLDFVLAAEEGSTGDFCLDRDSYPWQVAGSATGR